MVGKLIIIFFIMTKIKVTADVVNRGGKRYIAKDGFIEVDEQDMVFFE